MPAVRIRFPLALALSLGSHAGVALWVARMQPPTSVAPEPLQVNITLAPVQQVKPARPASPTPPSVEKKKRVHVPDAPLAARAR